MGVAGSGLRKVAHGDPTVLVQAGSKAHEAHKALARLDPTVLVPHVGDMLQRLGSEQPFVRSTILSPLDNTDPGVRGFPLCLALLLGSPIWLSYLDLPI